MVTGLRYGSVCSGIEAATVAWHPLGWEAQWFSEIEPFPCAVLAHHYKDVPNLGDMTAIHERSEFNDQPIDLLVGGTPCQSFSVAGLRKGLDDPRGNLALVFLSILSRKRPRWVVWENVPGVLSSWSDVPGSFHRGYGPDGRRGFVGRQSNDFDTFTGGLRELGYGLAWRILDAQYFGVPQRRRRVFVVGHLGDWRPPAAVLFERHSLQGNPPPRRKAGEGIAPTISARPSAGGGLGTDFDCDGGLIPFDTTQVTHPANRSIPQPGDPCHPLASGAHPPAIAFNIYPASGQGSELEASATDVANAVSAVQNGNSTERGTRVVTAPVYENHGQDSRVRQVDVVPQLNAKAGTGGNNLPLVGGVSVRRLTPRECERLQGFPDEYTLIKFRGKPAADGPRYKALGNSMATVVMAWIGRRIAQVDAIIQSAAVNP